MKILIIRHGDPYYPTDSLTEKGQREAELLGERLKKENITSIYVSPLGRAKLTAKPTAEKVGIEPIVLDWLQEIPVRLGFEYNTDCCTNSKFPWNIPPELWTNDKDIFNVDTWQNSDILKGSNICDVYTKVCKEFDNLIAKHGYVRDGNLFRIEENAKKEQTIALFCHGGIGTALIAHILNMPVIPAWNTIFLPPSSVTTIFMEEHIVKNSIAHAIFAGIADTSHLYAGNESISCMGLHTSELK